MKNNKLTKTSWIVLVIGFISFIIGIFLIATDQEKSGLSFIFIGIGICFLWCILLVIQSILATKKPWKTASIIIGIILAELAIIALGITFELGAVGTVILGLAVLFIGLLIKAGIDRTVCPKCGKKFAMKEISRKTVSTRATTIDVDRQVKNNKGEVIRTYKEAVPATHYIYDCIDECKFCGHRENVRREATYRN